MNAVATEKQSSTPLVAALRCYGEEGLTPFHTPGHKQGKGTAQHLHDLIGAPMLSDDLTEVEGLDDLHEPSGAIREAQGLAAELFGAERTFFLVNGGLAGFYAMLTAAARPGEKVLAARNLHPAAAAAITLSRIVPVYWQSEIDPATLLPREATAAGIEEGLRRFRGIRAVLVPGPSTAGYLPDWTALAAVCRGHDAALLADETAGIPFPGGGALPAGASAAVQEFRGVPGAPAQGGMLHIGAGRLDPVRVQAALGLIQTTSPSYLVMAGLDRARHWLARSGPAAAGKLSEQAGLLQQKISADLDRVTLSAPGPGRDPFYLTVTFPGRLISNPAAVSEKLRRTARAAIGLNSIVLRPCPGNNIHDLDQIADAIRAVKTRPDGNTDFIGEMLPECASPPMRPAGAPTARIPGLKALGKPAARRMVIVPPDTCVLYPGETIGDGAIKALAWQERRGEEDRMMEVYTD